MNVLRASAFNTSSSPVGSLASSMPQRASTKRAPIPIHVKRFLVRHRHRPARMRAQRAKGKAKFFFSFETTISSSFPSSSTVDCRLDLFSLLRRTKSAAANQSICGVSPQGGEIASRYCIIFFRSLANSRVRRAKVTHCRKFIGPTILTMTWPTVRPEYAPSAQTYTQNCGLECGQHPE